MTTQKNELTEKSCLTYRIWLSSTRDKLGKTFNEIFDEVVSRSKHPFTFSQVFQNVTENLACTDFPAMGCSSLLGMPHGTKVTLSHWGYFARGDRHTLHIELHGKFASITGYKSHYFYASADSIKDEKTMYHEIEIFVEARYLETTKELKALESEKLRALKEEQKKAQLSFF